MDVQTNILNPSIPKDLSIIIVNWNSKDYLRYCIATILSTTQGINFEIVVIDSASFDGCGEMLRQCYPDVRFIQSNRNIGFAMSNNEAFKVSHGRNLLFLNPDTELEEDAIHKLFHQLESLSNVGIVGAKLLNTDRSIQTWSIQSFPTILNQFLNMECLRRRIPLSRLWGIAPLFRLSVTSAEVDSVSGACMMIKRSVFERVGMFSTDYFMYSEDVDLCFKVKEAGWKVCYVPMAVVVHHGGASTSQSRVSVFSSVMMLESRWRFFRKTRPLWYCLSYRFTVFFSGAIRIGALLIMRPIFRLCGNASSLKTVSKKWTARLRWTLGGEKWVKKYGN